MQRMKSNHLFHLLGSPIIPSDAEVMVSRLRLS